MKRRKGKARGQAFWDREYQNADHLSLSQNVSEDLEKFCRYLEREHGRAYLNPLARVLDLGAGNGRNLVYLARTYGMRGVGYDISGTAIAQAKQASKDLPLSYEVRSIAAPLPLPEASQTLVLDMMTSHFLPKTQRDELYAEIKRVLRPGGWLFLKTFLRDEDAHAARLLREHPAEESGSYIHPEIGVAEHVFTQEEIEGDLGQHFTVHKVVKSHRHKEGGGKRRSISLYAEKES